MVSTSVASLETSHFQLAVVCFPSLACELHEANKGTPPPYFSKTSFYLFLFLSPVKWLGSSNWKNNNIEIQNKTKQNKKQKQNERQNLVNTLFKISPHHRSLCKFTPPSFALSSLQLEFARANLSLICISVSLSSPSISLVERRKKIRLKSRPSIKSNVQTQRLAASKSCPRWTYTHELIALKWNARFELELVCRLLFLALSLSGSA